MNSDGEDGDRHEVCEVGLDLAFVNVDDFEAILDEQLLALDGQLRLSSEVTLDLPQQS